MPAHMSLAAPRRARRRWWVAGAIAAFAVTQFSGAGIAHDVAGRGDADARDIVWTGTWGASPVIATDDLAADLTLRQVVRISAGGRSVRIRLSNEFGTQAVTIGDAHLAVSAGGAAIQAGTDHVLTFDGKASVTIPEGGAVLSDPADFKVPALTSLAVSVYLPNSDGPATEHSLGIQTLYECPGDLTSAVSPTGCGTGTKRYYLTGVAVGNFVTAGDAASIVTLGDSITDGDRSTTNADHRWPDFLADRLAKWPITARIGVVNQGIAGNDILKLRTGPAAIARFDRDVLTVPGVRFMTVLISTNDISGGAAADAIIAAYHQLIVRAHVRGIRAYGCTVTPDDNFSPDQDAVRRAVNAWIRTSGEYDAVIDFDAAVRDPNNPQQLLRAYDSGDGTHPNDAGYQAMADAIDLRLFKPEEDAFVAAGGPAAGPPGRP